MRSGACADSLSLVLAPYTSRYRPAHPSNCLSGGDWGVSRLYSPHSTFSVTPRWRPPRRPTWCHRVRLISSIKNNSNVPWARRRRADAFAAPRLQATPPPTPLQCHSRAPSPATHDPRRDRQPRHVACRVLLTMAQAWQAAEAPASATASATALAAWAWAWA